MDGVKKIGLACDINLTHVNQPETSNATHRIHDVDGYKRTNAVANVISAVVEGCEAGSAHLERSEHVRHLLVLVLPLLRGLDSGKAFCAPDLLHLDGSGLVTGSLFEDPKGQIEILFGTNEFGKGKEVKGKCEDKAGESTNDQTEHVRVVFLIVRKKNRIILNGCDAVGVGHLKADGEDHDKEGGGEDNPAGQAFGAFVGDPNFVDEPVEKEADDEGDGRGDQDAVENLVDAAALEGIWFTRVHSFKAFL